MNLSRIIDPSDEQAIRDVVMALCPHFIYPEGGHGANNTHLTVAEVTGGITNTLRRVARTQDGKMVCVCVCACVSVMAVVNMDAHSP